MPPRPLFLLLAALTVLRCVVAGAQELTPEEARVWLCGQHPALGYFDHGPLAAWLSGAGSWLAGNTPLGARLFAPWLMLAACLLGWRLALSAFGEKAAGWFVAVLQLTPLFNIGAIRALPETAAVAAGVAAWWWLWQALHRASPWTWQWLAAGAALGLAALAAPSGVLAGAGLLMVLGVPRRWRGQWRKPGPWLALLAMGLVVLPWILWQARADWLPWRSGWFSWGKEASAMSFVRWMWGLVMAASPFLFAGLAWAAGDGLRQALISWRRRRRGGLQADDPFDQKDGRVFLLALAAPGAVWALASAVAGEGTLAQAALPGLAALMLLAARWVEAPLPPHAHRLAQNAALLIAAAYSLLALHSDVARHAGLRWPYALDPTAEHRGWRESATQTARAASVLSRQNGGTPVFFLAETPGLAATLAFYLPQAVEGLPLVPGAKGAPLCHVPRTIAVENDFAFWPSYAKGPAFAGHAAIFAAESAQPEALALLRRHFASVESYGAFEVRRGGLPVRKLTLFACRGCQRPTQ